MTQYYRHHCHENYSAATIRMCIQSTRTSRKKTFALARNEWARKQKEKEKLGGGGEVRRAFRG
jgi:hypothetical protein